MERDNFIYKSYCEIAIVSDEVSPEDITEELNIIPERSFKKGEQSISKHSGSITRKPHNLWALKSKPIESDQETVSQHIEYLKSIFLSKLPIFQKYKKEIHYDVSFSIWIETDNAGIGFDLNEEEMAFVNSISNHLKISLITNDQV